MIVWPKKVSCSKTSIYGFSLQILYIEINIFAKKWGVLQGTTFLMMDKLVKGV